MGIKYFLNEKFFDTWSPQMAYVLGFICADGNIHHFIKNRGWYIKIVSTDKEIIEKIKNTMQSTHTISVVLPEKGGVRKNKYILRFGSKYIYTKLEERGLTPNKSLTMSFPHIPEKFLSDFTRGYFDGDGCIYIEKQKGRSSLRLRTIFTSGSYNFLSMLAQKLFASVKTKQTKVYNNHRSFQLSYSTKDSVLLFDFMYKNVYDELYLKRKKKIYNQFIKA